MQPLNTQPTNASSGQSWWVRWLIKGLAVALSLLALLLGVLTVIGISLSGLLAGLVLW